MEIKVTELQHYVQAREGCVCVSVWLKDQC